MPDKNGNLINQFSDYKFAIFEYIPGHIPKLDNATAYRVGELVGSAQKAFRNLTVDIKRRSWIEEKYNNRFSDCKFIEENYGSLKGILTEREYEITPKFVEWYKELQWNGEGVAEQIIHADIYNPNILDDSGKLALLDFEAVAYGSALIDSITYLAWDLLAKDEHAVTDEEVFARMESYFQGLVNSNGVIENPEFCYELISAICLGASVSNIAKAIKQNHNAFTRLERYFENVEFAQRNKRKLVELFTRFSH